MNEVRTVCALCPPGDIHRVGNEGPGTAVSIHVYGADIARVGSSIRRSYDLEVRQLGSRPPRAGLSFSAI